MKDMNEWRENPGAYVTQTWPFCSTMCSFRQPFRARVVITWRGVGCLYIMRFVGVNCKKGGTVENQGGGVKYMG